MAQHRWRTPISVLADLANRPSILRYGLLCDPHQLTDAVAKQQWMNALAKLLRSVHWDAYLVLTFRWEVSFALAKQHVEDWLRGLGPDIYAYVAYEEGGETLRTHVHVLITLLPRSRPFATNKTGLNFKQLAITRAANHWTSGHVDKAEPYDPRRGAAEYITKFPDTGEFYGTPRRQRTRATGATR